VVPIFLRALSGLAEQEAAPASVRPSQASGQNSSDDTANLSAEAKKELVKNHPDIAAKAGMIPQTKESKENKRRKQFFHKGDDHLSCTRHISSNACHARLAHLMMHSFSLSAGQLIYEWEQSLDEVNIYIAPPPGITAAMLDIEIKANHVMVGIKGNPERYLNVSLTKFRTNKQTNKRKALKKWSSNAGLKSEKACCIISKHAYVYPYTTLSCFFSRGFEQFLSRKRHTLVSNHAHATCSKITSHGRGILISTASYMGSRQAFREFLDSGGQRTAHHLDEVR
jgi:hypothetical protein